MTTVEHPAPPAPDRAAALAPAARPPLLSLVLIGAVFFWFLPQFTSIADVWTTVRAMTWLAGRRPGARRDLEPRDLPVRRWSRPCPG